MNYPELNSFLFVIYWHYSDCFVGSGWIILHIRIFMDCGVLSKDDDFEFINNIGYDVIFYYRYSCRYYSR
jgi:hypothetical protein